MSRFLGKIVKIIKAEKQLDMLDPNYNIEYGDPSSEDWARVGDDRDLRGFLQKWKKLTKDQYVDIIANRKIGNDWQRYARDIANNLAKEHNLPEINDAALKIVEENIKNAPTDNHRKIDSLQADKRAILSHLNISNKSISNAIENGDQDIIHNPNLEKQHLYKMVEKYPNYIGAYLEHPHFDDRMAEKAFTNPEYLKNISSNDLRKLIHKKKSGYDGYGMPRAGEEQRLDLNPRVIQSILTHVPDNIGPNEMSMMLDHVDPSFKKQWTDKVLGITDGGYEHTMPEDYEDGVEDEDFKNDNWNNWVEGGFNPELNSARAYLARSRHIDDEQAEHIKRHGDFQQKYDLYHNKHIDPRHGVEMFQKWYDDDQDHGYNAEDLIEAYKEHKDDIFTKDDISEETLEEIREEGWNAGGDYEYAEQEYSFDDYVNDHIDELAGYVELNDDHLDQLHEKLTEEYDDWTGENPNSSQNEGNPIFDALNKLHENFGDEYISPEELKNTTGVESFEELGLEPDEDDGQVDMEDVRSKLNEFGGPLMIDYLNSDDYTIHDHPDYQEREDNVIDDLRREILEERPYDFYDNFYEGYHESERFQNAQQEYIDNYVEENLKDHLDELYDTSHQDHRFIPDHLHAHIPNFREMMEASKAKALDTGEGHFLNGRIKDRSYDHEYGDGQHHHEMVVDHAIANGGSIDVGTMNKLYPAQKEMWKKVFAGKGKLTTDEAQAKVDALPKTKYEISYGKWGGGKMQNINNRDQTIFRLDHSADSLKPLMEDPELYQTFKKVQDVSRRSGHPTRDNSIAWARVDNTDPKHWMIDEVQSDFGKTVVRYLKENNADNKADHVQKISDYHKNWREALINKVLKEAKKHGVEKVSTHSPESKASHTGSQTIHSVYKDSYQKVPRQMGFQPDSHENLPLNNSGRESFKADSSDSNAKDLQGHTYNLTPSLLKKHMDDCLEYLEALEKGEIANAAKGAVLALGLGMAYHQMGEDHKQKAAEEFSRQNAPKHARSMATINPEQEPENQAYEQAKKEANDIIYRNDKNWFIKKYSNGLSPHVYKQTIKNNPELTNKYGYINDLSNSAFREVVEKNPNLRNDVHAAHYDKLHNEFGGDHEKILHAWKNGIKATHNKYADRQPASVKPVELGEQKSPDIIDETVKEAPEEPNFTHRRMFRGMR